MHIVFFVGGSVFCVNSGKIFAKLPERHRERDGIVSTKTDGDSIYDPFGDAQDKFMIYYLLFLRHFSTKSDGSWKQK